MTYVPPSMTDLGSVYELTLCEQGGGYGGWGGWFGDWRKCGHKHDFCGHYCGS